MNEFGHEVVVDGMFGPWMVGAVEAFQKRHQLPVSGQIDAVTLARLFPERVPPADPSRKAESDDHTEASRPPLDAEEQLRKDLDTAIRRGIGWTEPAITHEWTCELCGAHAGSVSVDQGTAAWREGFTGPMGLRLSETDADTLRRALARGDAAGAFAINYELTPWWCPECEKSYCGEHWSHWAVDDPDYASWLDHVQGWCPHGHGRKLED
jgi:hypothetical protein